MYIIAILNIISFGLALRAWLVVTGFYKDPLLASFEHYGEEQFSSPMIGLILWSSVFVYFFMYWYVTPATMFLFGIIGGSAIATSRGVLLRIIYRYKSLLRHYPTWFYEVMQSTDREERRRIAYMWLFLPASTRMIYNTNNRMFAHWVEQVILTVAR